MEPLDPYRDMTLTDLQREIEATATAAVLANLCTIPQLVAVTLRQDVAGRSWDIRLESCYYTAVDDEERPTGQTIIRYFWDASEPQVGEWDDWDPEEVMGRQGFERPEWALADAHATLAAYGTQDAAVRAET